MKAYFDKVANIRKLEKDFPFVEALVACPQDKKYHAEGDVWEHTKLCLEALPDIEGFSDLPEKEKQILWLATLLHDIGKPITTKEQEDEITSRKHCLIGAKMARDILWDTDTSWFKVDWDIREAVSNLVLLHMLPVHFIDKADPLYSICASSYLVKNNLLYILSMADNAGRLCSREYKTPSEEAVRFFRSYCEENDCYNNPKHFLSEPARFRYFYERNGHPDFDRYEEFRGEAVMMSGIQGVGKSHVIKKNYLDKVIIGLDETRELLKVKFGKDEGEVFRTTKDFCLQLMREKKNLVFNATNTTRDARRKWIDLFRAYGYYVIIHYVETPIKVALKNNKKRKAFVPENVILSKFRDMEVPTPLECHHLILETKSTN